MNDESRETDYESEWYEVNQSYITGTEYENKAIFSTTFDYENPLVWVGDNWGRVSSYVINNDIEPLDQYSGFVVTTCPIKSLKADKRGIWTLAENILQLRSCGGMIKTTVKANNNESFGTFTLNRNNENEIILTNDQRKAYIVNMDRGTVQKTFEVENGVTAQDFKKEYILGTATGLLVLRDPRMSYKITNWVEAYSGGVGYISEVGSHLLTSGWSIMNSSSKGDWSVKLFDVRNLKKVVSEYKTVAPAQFCNDNKRTEAVVAVYPDGYVEKLEIVGSEIQGVNLFQAECYEDAMFTAGGMTANGEAVVVGDTQGIMHLWSKSKNSLLHDMELGSSVPIATSGYKRGSAPFMVDDESVRLLDIGPLPHTFAYSSGGVADMGMGMGMGIGVDADVDVGGGGGIGTGFNIGSGLNNNGDSNVTLGNIKLLSDVLGKEGQLYDVGKPVCQVTDSEFRQVKMHGMIGSIPNYTRKKHNQVVVGRDWRREKLDEGKPGINVKFRSQKVRSNMYASQGEREGKICEYKGKKDSLHSPTTAAESSHLQNSTSMLSSGLSGSPTVGSKSKSQSGSGSGSRSRPGSGARSALVSGISSKAAATERIMSKYDANDCRVPQHFKRVEIEYSKYGIEDFDFGEYNKTQFGGLESNIQNSYMNSLFQVMYFMPEIREMTIYHSRTKCELESCLLCELGFLNSMLRDSEGANCQATNVLRLIGCDAKAGALNILEPELPSSNSAPLPYTRLVQSAFRFILETINMQSLIKPIENSSVGGGHDDDDGGGGSGSNGSNVVPFKYIETEMGIPITTEIECSGCGYIVSHSTRAFAVELSRGFSGMYNTDNALISTALKSSIKKMREQLSFARLVDLSLTTTESGSGVVCAKCKCYNRARLSRRLAGYPGEYIAINSPLILPTVTTQRTNTGPGAGTGASAGSGTGIGIGVGINDSLKQDKGVASGHSQDTAGDKSDWWKNLQPAFSEAGKNGCWVPEKLHVMANAANNGYIVTDHKEATPVETDNKGDTGKSYELLAIISEIKPNLTFDSIVAANSGYGSVSPGRDSIKPTKKAIMGHAKTSSGSSIGSSSNLVGLGGGDLESAQICSKKGYLVVHLYDQATKTWYLFNDFCVEPIPNQNVHQIFQFASDQRVPSIFFYRTTGASADANTHQLQALDYLKSQFTEPIDLFRLSSSLDNSESQSNSEDEKNISRFIQSGNITMAKKLQGKKQKASKFKQGKQQLQGGAKPKGKAAKPGKANRLINATTTASPRDSGGGGGGREPHDPSKAVYPLTLEELDQIQAGTFVCAMDAEFVLLADAETEVHSSGALSLHRPKTHSLARLSVVRVNPVTVTIPTLASVSVPASASESTSTSESTSESTSTEIPNNGTSIVINSGVPFIDDYILTTVPIANYLTEYSGIREGDLDPATSNYNLVSFKHCYKKLRYLVDNHTTFIGHGLESDFRTINIHVPKRQVVNTTVLFQSPKYLRLVNLKFLAWYFLDTYIQQSEHCSIEDSVTALKLYKKYQELQSLGLFESKLEDMYQKGFALGWKPPQVLPQPPLSYPVSTTTATTATTTASPANTF